MGLPHETSALRPIYEEIGANDRELFAELYAIYARLFPLPDEREPPEAFEEIFALNRNPDAQKSFGPWREIVAGIRLIPVGPLVGGHVFGVTTSPAHLAFGCQASVQAIYTFLEGSARGRGALGDARSYITGKALETFGLKAAGGRMPPLILFEVNNPSRMTQAQIEEDRSRSGLDPHRRYMFWKRNGFSPLDFHYIQPRLRPDAEPVRYLDLFCTADVGDAIPAELIEAHLRAFISVSVLKGRDAYGDPDFVAMSCALCPGTNIRFVADSDSRQREIAMRALHARKF